MITVPDIIAAIEDAEYEARREHDAGTCHESEWSCSYCEHDETPLTAARAVRG